MLSDTKAIFSMVRNLVKNKLEKKRKKHQEAIKQKSSIPAEFATTKALEKGQKEQRQPYIILSSNKQ